MAHGFHTAIVRYHDELDEVNSSQQLSVVLCCSAGASAHASGSSLGLSLRDDLASSLSLFFTFDLGSSNRGLLCLVCGGNDVA